MAKWIEVLKDRDWAMVRAEAVNAVWVSKREDKTLLNFDINGERYYLIYPKDTVLHLSEIRKWFDVDFDNLLTLWHFYMLPREVTEFIISSAFADYLTTHLEFWNFGSLEAVEQRVKEVFKKIQEKGEN